MNCYYTGASPDNLRESREHAPSHTHGYGWTPQKMTPHDAPYFLDNGAYTGAFDKREWLGMLARARETMPRPPDFVVWPDVYGDAEQTRERVRDIYRHWHPDDLRLAGFFDRYVALQPGLSIEGQLAFAENCGATGVFVGGSKRWKRAHGSEIVQLANRYGLRTHVGNPGGKDGLVWAYRAGFDSCDTTTVIQNGYWHYLDKLERATEETGPEPGDTRQVTLAGGGPA